MSYADLLARREKAAGIHGVEVDPSQIHDSLKPFQKKLTAWAVLGGRRAVWADTGLGKTRMQIEWCRLSADRSLILAPLAVCEQTIEEAAKIGVTVRYIRSDDEIDGDGVYITNHEMAGKLTAPLFGAVALDEASILKQSTGKTRNLLIEHYRGVPYRTTWTATPGPNDPEELTNQAEFLGQMSRVNMLAAYFVHDQDGWRLKGHAFDPMITWMSTWAAAVRYPSDMGDSDTGYILPKLSIIPEIVTTEIAPEPGTLFATDIGGVTGRSKVRRETLEDRVARAVELVASEPDEPWMFWCGLNDEANALAKALPGSVNIHGSLTPEEKADGLHRFAHGEVQILISKPSIASMGLNWQHCARTAFVGLSDSYEQYYQCIRRFWRFGQTREVNAHIILSVLEQQIAENVQRKEQSANRIIDALRAKAKELR